jgi:putative DNA primase/helicase
MAGTKKPAMQAGPGKEACMAAMTQTTEAALNYASRGLPVFPCGKDKKPLTGHGFKDATTDHAVIQQWWCQYTNALIGMPTGVASGLFVLDVDMPYGPASLKELERKYGPLPATVMQKTPSGGRHLFFKHPGKGSKIKNSAGKLGPGLDIRGDGGYVILAPSPGYEWIEHDHC